MAEEVKDFSESVSAAEPPHEGELSDKDQVAAELKSEVKQWAEAISKRNHDVGGLLVRARETESGEMIALGILGTRKT